MKVKCIKDYEYYPDKYKPWGTNTVLVARKDLIYNVKGEVVLDGDNDIICYLYSDDYDNHFVEVNECKLSTHNTPPYVRCYFYPNGDENEGCIKKIEGWLDNDFPSNLAIITKGGCLCKFKFKNIEQMYPVKEPNDITYDEVNKWHLG